MRTLRIAAVIGCIALLGLGVGGYALAHSDMAEAWLRDRITAALWPRVTFGDVRVTVWPRFGAVLNRVALRPADNEAAAPLISADAIRCRLGLRALFDGRVDIQTVVVDGLALTVARTAAGAIQVEGLEPLPAAGSTTAPAAWPALHLHDARITVVDASHPGPPRTLVLAPIEARVVPKGAGTTFELTLDGSGGAHLLARGTTEQRSLDSPFALHVEVDDVDAAAAAEWLATADVQPTASGRVRATLALHRSGGAIDGEVAVEVADGGITVREWRAIAPLKLSAQLAWDAPAFALTDGKAELARLEHGDLAAETLRAGFAYADGALQVRGAEARAFGGFWTQSGQVTLADPVVIAGGLRGERIDSARLLAALPALGVSAALPQADGQLAVSLDGSGAAGGAFAGHVSVDLAGGGITWDGVRVAAPLQIAADVAVADGATALTNGQARVARVSRDRLTADAVDVEFSYAADALHVAPLRLNALGGTWTYTGTLPVRAGGAWAGALAANAVRVDQVFTAAQAHTGDAPTGTPPNGALDVRATVSSGPRNSVRGTATLRLASPALEWGDVRVTRPASVSAGVLLDHGALVLSRGRLDAARASVAGNAADDLSAQFSGTQDRLQLSGLTARAFGGAWQASGTVTPAVSPPFSGTISGTGVRLEPLLIAAGQGDGDAPSSPTGVADLRLTVGPAAGGAIGGNAALQLHAGAFLLGNLVVDAPAQFASDFRVRDDDLALTSATASAGRALFGELGGTQAKAQFSYAKERLTFSALQFTAGGGAWSHNGTYSFAGAHPFSGHLTIRDADPRSVMLLLSAAEPTTIDLEHLDADVDFSGRLVDDWSETLDASGDLFVRGGSMRSSAVLRAMWEAMFGKSASMDKLGAPNRVDSAGGTFTLDDGVVHTQDLALHSADYIATAAGTFALAGPIDLAARFTLTAQGMQKMIAFGSIALPTSSLPPLPPIPAEITGTLDDPIIRPNVAAVPAATLRWFVDAVLHAPRGLLGAVVNRAGEAWSATKRLFGGSAPAAPAP